MGCDEFYPEMVFTREPHIGFRLQGGWFLSAEVAGSTPLQVQWFRNGIALSDDAHYQGTHSTTLWTTALTDYDQGLYHFVASNALGMVTSAMSMAIHFVNPHGANSQPPFLSWDTAATNIQQAIDVCSSREVVLVTNGTFSLGGRTMGNADTNRVVLDKPVLVQSVNGPGFSVLDSGGITNSRCAWITNGAALGGFTLKGGYSILGGAGGAWCASTNAVMYRCIFTGNRGNSPVGVRSGSLYSCLVSSNSGRAVEYSALYNCTVYKNDRGTYNSRVYNSIVYSNSVFNSSSDTFAWSCTTPAQPGISNISSNPKLMPDEVHLSVDSPCLGAGTNLGPGLDLDGMPVRQPAFHGMLGDDAPGFCHPAKTPVERERLVCAFHHGRRRKTTHLTFLAPRRRDRHRRIEILWFNQSILDSDQHRRLARRQLSARCEQWIWNRDQFGCDRWDEAGKPARPVSSAALCDLVFRSHQHSGCHRFRVAW